jgi:hypothetical protein
MSSEQAKPSESPKPSESSSQPKPVEKTDSQKKDDKKKDNKKQDNNKQSQQPSEKKEKVKQEKPKKEKFEKKEKSETKVEAEDEKDDEVDEKESKITDWFIEHRVKKWEELAAKQKAEFEEKAKKSMSSCSASFFLFFLSLIACLLVFTDEAIEITLKDGKKLPGVAYVTTPFEIAKGLSKSLAEKAIVAKLDGDEKQLWDISRPLEKSCKLEILTFEDAIGNHTFWHSSAHILGEALELSYPGARLCIGPPVQEGFYYDVHLPNKYLLPIPPLCFRCGFSSSCSLFLSQSSGSIKEEDLKTLEKKVKHVIKQKQKFERLSLKKEDALEMFKDNKFKCEIIKEKVPDGAVCTAYRCGPLIDLCKGPHVSDTSRINSIMIVRVRTFFPSRFVSVFLPSLSHFSFNRTVLPTGRVMSPRIRCNVFTVFHSPTSSASLTTRRFLKKPQSVITKRLAPLKNSFSFTTSALVLASSFLMALVFTTNSSNLFVVNTASVVTRKLLLPMFSTAISGRLQATTKTTRNTCSFLKVRFFVCFRFLFFFLSLLFQLSFSSFFTPFLCSRKEGIRHEAYELSWSLFDVRLRSPLLQRPSSPFGRLWCSSP